MSGGGIGYLGRVYSLLKPFLFALRPETAHGLTFGVLRWLGPLGRGVSSLSGASPSPRLAVNVAGLPWASPVGLAAGMDKNGHLTRFWPTLGFGAVELGTVTALAQPGNPRPRLFRFPEQGALINRMGFNNQGSQALAARLTRLRGRKHASLPIGVNLGKSKVTPLEQAVDDYRTSTERVASLADYLVVNVSSPNTPGLRELQAADHLGAIVEAVVASSQGRPVFVKVAPDLHADALAAAVSVAEAQGAAGIIAANTTIDHQGIGSVGNGGLSGRPLRSRTLEVVRQVRGATRLPIIAVGGITSADHVLDALAAGASAVQVYSALVFEGPGLVHRINRELVGVLDANDCESLSDLLARPASSWRPEAAS